MKLLFSLYLLLTFSSVYGQFQEVFPQPAEINKHPAWQQLSNAYQAGRWEESFNLAIALSDRYPEEGSLYVYIGNTLFRNKQYSMASQYYQAVVALYPFQPTNLTSAVLGAMYAKDPQVITHTLHILSFIPMSANEKAEAERHLQEILNNFTNYTDYSGVTSALQQGLQQYRQHYTENMTFHEQYVQLLKDFNAQKSNFPKEAFIRLKSHKNAGSYPTVLYNYILGGIAASCVNGKEKTESLFRELLPEFNAVIAEKREHTLSKYYLYKQMKRYGDHVKDYEAIILASKIMLAELNSSGITPSLSYEVLINLTYSFLKKNDINQAKEYGQTLAAVIPKIVIQEDKINAYNAAAVAMSYIDKNKSAQLFDEGIAYAKRTGTNDGGLVQNKDAFINQKISNELKNDAQSFIAAENQGILFTDQGNYKEAIPHFIRSKKIIETEMATASSEKTKGLLADYNRVCNLLIGCIAHEQRGEDLLPVIEDVKGYSLAESTSKSKKRATLKEIQTVLQPDEALIYYIDISSNLYDGYYIPLLLTKDKVHFGFSFARNSLLPDLYGGFNAEIGAIEKELAQKEFRTPVYTQYQSREQAQGQDFKQGELGLLIEWYRRKLAPQHEELRNGTYNPNIAKAAGMAFYNMLLQMFEPQLAGKKHLIFSLDGELNYLPFETLFTEDRQYLVQKYDVSYIPSGTVLVNLRNRKTKTYSKPVLAFGDARYSARTAEGYALKSQTDIERVELKVKEAIANGQHLDPAFATFSKTAATYLEGTKKEVEMIKTIVPEADIFLNEKMTENEFKRLNASGALNNYRIIHLASHAGVHPYVFDLSGIMFSVFPQPLDGEDGELVVSEVAKLKMAPELVMLSACQTGLGKLVPGDGVAGLNHAFLMAGANATITSLWNVNDYATSVLVSRLYQKVFQDKKDYVKALNEVKREFITSGDPMLQLSLSWAPFIYTGR
ncbi:CHAT domain-containing protein [Gynurincola endophyticus]|uniref:CHAT domain-containing protein n=1 Tax=Gynurincola endophyticus TaxID=2479004 RepID=UPI000F8CD41A|nr:CHAT domain-containing protein [Gynurincola endophyticus]